MAAINDAELDPDAGLYVVQFRAPLRDAWLAELAAAGAELVQYVPWNAYVIAGYVLAATAPGLAVAGRSWESVNDQLLSHYRSVVSRRAAA